MYKFLFGVLLFSFSFIQAQELNALVTINTDKVQSSNKQVYRTLEKSLTEFINQTQWTSNNYKPQERINCAFTIIINDQNNNQFTASLQIQATRPVYNSSYATPILNINDQSFNFKYNEFDPLLFNPTMFDSNLISTIVFYVYVILGLDSDTFALKGGQQYLKSAENVMLQAQQSLNNSWQNQIGKQNKFALIDNLLSPKFEILRKIYYNYHRQGFDYFANDKNKAKKSIEASILELDKLHNITIGNYMIRIFLDAKIDEIVSVFSDNRNRPTSSQQRMVQILRKISPTYENKWKKIK